jgi:MerR family transcriptional regulator/heat shock protein HspR
MADEHQALFLISHIAKMLGMHPQTLRLYERVGFITPSRTRGNTRLYSRQDIEQLRLILHLTRDLGVNLAGVEIILSMRRKLEKIQREVDHLQQDIAACLQRESLASAPRYALMKAPSRKLIKVK